MSPIVTLLETFSLTLLLTLLTLQFLLFFVVTLTWSLIIPLIALVLPLTILLGKALLLLSIFLTRVVLWTSGDTFIRHLLSPGPGRMGLLLSTSTLSVVLISGCPLCRHVMSFLVPSLIIMQFCFVLLSPRLLLLAWDFGNLMCLSSMMMNMFL